MTGLALLNKLGWANYFLSTAHHHLLRRVFLKTLIHTLLAQNQLRVTSEDLSKNLYEDSQMDKAQIKALMDIVDGHITRIDQIREMVDRNETERSQEAIAKMIADLELLQDVVLEKFADPKES